MQIRKAEKADLEDILAIYKKARAFMAANGNPNQWGNNKPAKEQIEDDIEKGKSYVCVSENGVAAVFYFAVEADPTYSVIEGEWINDLPYGVVHRIASSEKGAGSFCLNWAYSQCHNVRIDTHENNLPMQNLLKKLGYSRCGTIIINDGTPRIVFQKYQTE